MLDIQTFFALFVIFHCLELCLAEQQQLWGVRLFTGDKSFAGTNQEVYLKLQGTKGFSLMTNVSNLAKNLQRQRNMVDYYYLYYKDVGELQTIHLKLGSGKDSWFLRRVELEKLDSNTRVSKFIGIQTRKLSANSERTMHVFNTQYWFKNPGATTSFDLSETTTDRTFVVRVVTSDMEDAGTASQGYIKFYNDQLEVESDVLEIKYDDERAVLRTGGTDTFQYTTKHIGIPTGVKMWFKRQATYPDRLYRLDRIELEDIESDGKRKIYTFRSFDWMKLDEEKIHKIPRSKIHLASTYRLRISTWPWESGDTSSAVFIKLLSFSNKETDWIGLDDPDKDDFEGVTDDLFLIEIQDIGLFKGFNLKVGGWDSWRMRFIIIELPLQTGWKSAYYKHCLCWVYKNRPVSNESFYYLLPDKPVSK